MIKRDDIPLGYTYDTNGRALTFKDADGYWSEYTRDIHGNVLTYKNSDGYWSEYTYDANGNELTYKPGKINLDVESAKPTLKSIKKQIDDLQESFNELSKTLSL